MKKLLSITAIAFASSGAFATDLSTIYRQAASNDAEIAAARATREASGYNVNVARSAILPQAQAAYSYTHINADSHFGSTDTNTNYDLGSLQLSASQTLFNLNSWYTWQAAKTADQGYALQLQLSEQQLLLNTAQAYFNVLRAHDNLTTGEAEEKAVKRSLEQTRQRFDVGLIAITEVQEAQASYDLTYVNLLSLQAALDVSYEALETLTGQRYDKLSFLRDNIIMAMPEPAVADEWVATGMAKYPGVQMAIIQKDTVGQQRDAARANHLPTVKLAASYTTGDNSPTSSYPHVYDSEVTSIGVNVSMPLFAGGSIYAQSKQAASNYAAADYQLESSRRQVKQSIRSLFRQLQTSVQNIDARKQAITSAQSAVDATQTGYQVGTRNIVEVLNAQKNLFSAQRDYANARYDYIINLLSLKFYSGTINEGDIDALNSWLSS
jgi:outer membrane protein